MVALNLDTSHTYHSLHRWPRPTTHMVARARVHKPHLTEKMHDMASWTAHMCCHNRVPHFQQRLQATEDLKMVNCIL
jgi:hypothetical protein